MVEPEQAHVVDAKVKFVEGDAYTKSHWVLTDGELTVKGNSLARAFNNFVSEKYDEPVWNTDYARRLDYSELDEERRREVLAARHQKALQDNERYDKRVKRDRLQRENERKLREALKAQNCNEKVREKALKRAMVNHDHVRVMSSPRHQPRTYNRRKDGTINFERAAEVLVKMARERVKAEKRRKEKKAAEQRAKELAHELGLMHQNKYADKKMLHPNRNVDVTRNGGIKLKLHFDADSDEDELREVLKVLRKHGYFTQD